MSDSCWKAASEMEPFEDRVDVLFQELELAIHWQRPSILFAVYGSERLLTDAELALEGKLIDLGQKAFRFRIKDEESADIAACLAQVSDPQHMVFFVSGLKWGGGPQGLAAYSALNQHREYFIENQIRIVFWLTEEEAVDLAHHAPDYWAYRHRVIDFVESDASEEVLTHALESALQGSGETSDSPEEIDAKISLNESLLTDLPEGDGSTAMNANLYLTLGVLHWRRGDTEKATQFLQTALQAAITMEDKWFEAECLNAMALVYSDLGRVDDAIEAYQQAIQLAPDQIFPWNNLGNLYIKLGRNEDALAAFHRAIEHNPTDAVSWNGLGNAYFKMGRIGEANSTYHQAIELAPDFAPPWNGLGSCCARLGQLDQAREAYQKATHLNVRDAQPWIGLGSLASQQGKQAEALKSYWKAIDLDPKSAAAWEGLAETYQGLGDNKNAETALRKAHELEASIAPRAEDPLPAPAPEEIQGEGQSPLVDEPFSSFPVEEAPSSPDDPLPQQEAIVPEEGRSQVQEAVPAGGEDPEGESPDEPEPATIEQGNEGSVSTMNADSKTAVEWNRLGHTHLKAGSYDEAIAAYIKAIEVSPDLAWPYIHNLAMAHYHKGEQRAKAGGMVTCSEKADNSMPPSQPVGEGSTPEASAGDRSTTDPTQPMARVAKRKLESVSPEGPQEAASAQLDVSTGEMGDWLRQLESEKGSGLEGAEAMTGHYLNDAIREDLYGFGRTESVEDQAQASPSDPEQGTGEGSPDTPAVPAEEPSDPSDPPADCSEGEPQDAYEWNELGNIQLKAGSCDEAIQAYERAIELEPEFGWPYSNLGLAYSHKGKYKEAIPLYQMSIELLRNNKEKAITYNRMGDAYRRLNDHDNAVKSYQKAVQLDSASNSLLKRVRLSLLGNLRA
jgi:tetratricopeptide (TPR) repeat protein